MTEVWIPMSERTPLMEGGYLVYADSADPSKPFRHVAWWSTSCNGWTLVVEPWANAITHWAPFPESPGGGQ